MDSRTNALIGIVVSLGLLTVSDKATVGTEAPLSTDAYHGRAILFYPHDLEQSGRITFRRLLPLTARQSTSLKLTASASGIARSSLCDHPGHQLVGPSLSL